MSTYEIFSVAFSAISILISIISLSYAYKSNSRASKLQQGQVELEISKYITETKNKVLEMSLKKAENSIKDDEIFLQALKAAIENNLNAYEEACSKYLDGKIDKTRFTKTYKSEIRNLVESFAYKRYFDGVTSRFKAILKVYDEWENLEK